MKKESFNIEKEKQNFFNNENMNDTLINLKNNDNLGEYKDKFNFILSQEQRNLKNKKLEIKYKIHVFKKIKSSWENNIYYIYNNYSNFKGIKNKLNDLVEKINKYKSIFISEKCNNDNILQNKYNNSFYVSNNYNNKYKGNNIRNSSFDVKYI